MTLKELAVFQYKNTRSGDGPPEIIVLPDDVYEEFEVTIATPRHFPIAQAPGWGIWGYFFRGSWIVNRRNVPRIVEYS